MVLVLVLCPLSVPLLLGLPFLVLDQVQHHQVSCDWRTAGHVTTVLISDWSSLCPASGSMCPPPKIIIVFDEKYLIHSNINIQQYWREQDRKERCCASFNIVWIVSIIACSSVGSGLVPFLLHSVQLRVPPGQWPLAASAHSPPPGGRSLVSDTPGGAGSMGNLQNQKTIEGW